MAALLLGVMAAMLLNPVSAFATPTLTVTIDALNYVDDGPVTATVTVAGAAGMVTFRRTAEPDCSGESTMIGNPKPIGANGTITGPNLNDLTLGRFGLYVRYTDTQGQTVNKCAPYAILRHSHVLATLPKQQFDIGQRIEPAVTLGVTPTAGGSISYLRFGASDCTGPESIVGKSNVVNGVVQQTRDYQDRVLGVRSYRVLYSGDEKNSKEHSVCRPYAVGAFIRGMVFKDANANGTLEDGEQGLAGVKLTLRRDGSTVDTVTTGDSGVYELFVISTGEYLLEQTQPSGYGSSTPNQLSINISGPSVTGKNFGETLASPSPSPSPVASELEPSPSDTPSEQSSPPVEERGPVSVVLWIGIGLVLLATVLLLVLVAAARRREE